MTAAASTHLVIADDHPLFRDALRQAVASVVASAKIDEAGAFEELTALLGQDSDIDMILLDLSMPGISGFSGLIYLRAQYPAIPVVIVSASDDIATIRSSLDFGASGFIPKRFGVETLREAIGKVMAGEVWVPPDVDLSAAADPENGSSGSEEEEMTAEEAAAAAVEQMQALQASIAQLEQLLSPLLHTPLQSLTQQLPPIQAAKLEAALAYTTNALFLCRFRLRTALCG